MLERCISRSVPASMIPVMYGNNYQIIQSPGLIVITYEIIHEARVIPLDGRPHLGANVRAHMGDARGRWEGNSLVVETTNFTSASAYRNANADTFRVIERFTRVAAGSHRMDRHPRRSEDVDQAVDDRDAAYRRSESDLSVRVPRAQLRIEKHPERSESGGTK